MISASERIDIIKRLNYAIGEINTIIEIALETQEELLELFSDEIREAASDPNETENENNPE